VHPEPSEKRARMVSGSMPVSRVRGTPSPGKDRSTVNDEVTGTDESSPVGLQSDKDKERLVYGSTLSFTKDVNRLSCCAT
jgi:hypothetical protein